MSSRPFSLSLLTLPREIRDEIYINLFLLCETPPPSGPSEAGRRLKDPHEQFIDRQIAYTCTLPPIPSLALLACCRQTRREIQAILDRNDLAERRRATIYRLDCMVKPFIVWPTWIRLPGPLAHVHVMEVDFRFFPHQMATRVAANFRFNVFYLLQRLPHHGLRFYAEEGSPPLIRIELLTLIIAASAITVAVDDAVNESGLDEQASDLILERIWGPFLALERYGLLSHKVGKLQLRCGRAMKEVHVRGGSTVATGVGAWNAWLLRHPQFRP